MDYHPWQLNRTEIKEKTGEQVINYDEGQQHEGYCCRGTGHTQKKYSRCSNWAELLQGGITWHSKANNRKKLHASTRSLGVSMTHYRTVENASRKVQTKVALRVVMRVWASSVRCSQRMCQPLQVCKFSIYKVRLSLQREMHLRGLILSTLLLKSCAELSWCLPWKVL